MRKKVLIICFSLLFIVACASTNNEGAQKVNQGFGKAVLGIAQLVLSPLQIAAGLLEGIASVPYYLSTSLEEINKGMIAGNAKVTIDDTYEAAYGKRINAVPESGDTGEVFRRMKHASEYFQKILSRYGVPDAKHYILTSIDTANSKGYTLFAVVYRPADKVTFIDKYDGATPRTYEREDRMFYEPVEKDINGKKIDTIIDWSGLPRDLITTQKGQALMLTMAANAVVNDKRSPDYWEIEKRWIAGDFETIVEQKMNAVKNKMKIEEK
jgi:hypothetical protein